MTNKDYIEAGKAYLGIELGSTRIKAVMIDNQGKVLASGGHGWENQLENGIWTYSLDMINTGIKSAYAELAEDVQNKYGIALKRLAGIGISAMMHGYMAFDKEENLLVPFRTWRNTITEQAADELTEVFDFNVPQRWSVSHLYQAILNKEEHISSVAYVTTLSGYIHYLLTGKKVIGIGDASGMFPIDSETFDYDQKMVDQFDEILAGKGLSYKLRDVFPEVLCAGQCAGTLTAEGAAFLDVSGNLEAGIPLCPPEGDAGTGMVATNSVAMRTGNVSAGTSIFAMIVLERKLSKVYREIDMVTTPDGSPVAMSHANNCTSDLNAWVGLFAEFAQSLGLENIDMGQIYGTLYRKALEGDKDCGGNMAYGFYSGENVIPFDEGRPLYMRKPNAVFNLANFMRANLYTAFGAMKIGCDILLKDEKVKLDRVTGHGGIFKTKGVAQSFMAAALETSVTVLDNAGEGGAWGIALLAAYMDDKKEGESLGDYLDQRIFADAEGTTMDCDPADVEGFATFMEGYKAGLAVEKAAVENY